jgi:subtilisin-like proprotein convertase family protein
MGVSCVAALAQESETQPTKFGALDGKIRLPKFGKDKLIVPYSVEDLQRAEQIIVRYDKNRDGVLDSLELKDGTWRSGKPLDYDFDGDGKINKIEMAQRFSARFIRDETYIPPAKFSVLDQMRKDNTPPPESESRRGSYRSQDGNRRSQELAYDIFSRYDRDLNRRLDAFERKELGIDVTKFDLDGDSSIDRSELYQWIDSQIGERAGDLTDILPDWFFERDANKDEQVDMSEFTDQWSEELLAQFKSLDENQDGVITAIELVESRSIIGGTYSSTKATLLSPRSNATSSIDIQEDLPIEKLRVQLTITHDFTEQLSTYLIAPNGTKIDLFRGPGGSGDHFEGTIFDDEADERIQRAKSPFRGSYQPVAMEKNQPSLGSLLDSSLKGEWQLVIDADRNQRFGILHSWSILVVPRKQKSLPVSSESTTLENN